MNKIEETLDNLKDLGFSDDPVIQKLKAKLRPETVTVEAGELTVGDKTLRCRALEVMTAAVTQQEYKKLTGGCPSDHDVPMCPVTNVSWFDACKYANQKSERDGLTPAYKIAGEKVTWDRDANGWRLPEEEEWEYLCRAGTTTERYGDLDEIAWYSKNSGGRPHPVGQKKPNAFGLYDMLGNTWDWCWDEWK